MKPLSELIPGGCSTYSKRPARYAANAPGVAYRARGALIDTDKGRLIDYTSALGAIILGYAHGEVSWAARDAVNRGVSFSLPTQLEHDLATRMLDIVPGMEMVRFGKNGNDVTNAAVRIARAHTGRKTVVMFSNGYHGHADWAMTRPPKNGGITGDGETRFVTPFDADELRMALEIGDVACVIMEAVVSGDPVLPDRAYFEQVREICDERRVIFILDEMVTGFRMGFPGALTEYGIRPDMVCYGKAIANGFPLSVLLGSRELMMRIEQDVFYSTTFAGENVSIAAALATLGVLEREDVSSKLAKLGRDLRMQYDALAVTYGFELETDLHGYPQRLMMRWDDPSRKQRFLEALIDNGVLCQGYFNLTLAHADKLIFGQTVQAFEKAFEAVMQFSAAPAAV